MTSTCSSLCKFIIVYLTSCLNSPIIFHNESNVVSTNLILGFPLRLTVPAVSVKLTGCRASPLNVIVLVGAPGGSFMMLFRMFTFLSSYTCENLFICLSHFPGNVVLSICVCASFKILMASLFLSMNVVFSPSIFLSPLNWNISSVCLT